MGGDQFSGTDGNLQTPKRVSLTEPYSSNHQRFWIIMRLATTALSAGFLVFGMAGSLQAQTPLPLGPKDGRDLPPTDLERVAVGTMAPDFTLESLDGEPITLSAFQGKKDVVLVFYRGHW